MKNEELPIISVYVGINEIHQYMNEFHIHNQTNFNTL